MYLLSPRKATWNHLIQYMSVYDILIHQTLLTLLFKGHHCCFSLSASHLSFHPIYSDISRGTKINQWGISRHHQTTYLILGIWLSLWLRTTSWSIFRKTHDSINFALYWMFLGSPLATFWCHWWAERISFFGFLRFSDHSISTPFLYQYYTWVSNEKNNLHWVSSKSLADLLQTTIYKFTLMIYHNKDHFVAERYNIVWFLIWNMKEVGANLASHRSKYQSFHAHLIFLADCST